MKPTKNSDQLLAVLATGRRITQREINSVNIYQYLDILENDQ